MRLGRHFVQKPSFLLLSDAMRALIFGFAICAWLAPCRAARAAETTLALAVAECEASDVSAERLRELTRAEVAAADFVVIDASLPSAVRGAIQLCHGSPELVTMSVGTASQPTVERTVDLSDVVGELRARTVAVAFAELLTMLSRGPAEAAPPPGPKSSPPESATTPALARPAASRARPPEAGNERAFRASPRAATASALVRVEAGLGLRVFARPITVFAGPWLSLGLARFRAEGFYLQASDRVTLGTAYLRTVGVAAAWSPWQAGTRLRVSLHCRGELGMTWATGSPAGSWALGATRNHGQAALAAESHVDVPWSSTLAFQARFTAGAAFGPTATAERVAVVRSGGPFAGAALGISLGF